MIHVSFREMNRAFLSHCAVLDCEASEFSLSHGLLLVYAVECGLKVAVMKRENASGTQEINEHLLSHDLRELLKYLRAPAGLTIPRVRCLQRSRVFESHELHEVFRYGIRLEIQSGLIAGLRRVLDWIREDLL